jgi:hypothetical protein
VLCLLKISRDLQILFAAVTHLVEGLHLEIFLGGKVFNWLSGYTETNSIHTRKTVNFVLENVNIKYSVKIFSPEIKRFEMEIIKY